MIIIHSLNANTPLPYINDEPDFSSVDDAYKPALIEAWQNGDFSLATPINIPEISQIPNPIAFYEKMIGAMGECPLNDVYKSTSGQALNPNIDTSSLNYAAFLFKGALDNDWSKPYARGGFAEAYGILKAFLSPEQIVIVDTAIAEFNL